MARAGLVSQCQFALQPPPSPPSMSVASWFAVVSADAQHPNWANRLHPRRPTAMAQNRQTANSASGPNTETTTSNKDKNTSDQLFGPNIGPCPTGPSWTTGVSKKLISDDLTPEILSTWIEKSKQPSQPTTTLQALVNLKRPTLRLSPLSSVPEDLQSPLDPQQQHLHALEFEYDCDAPKCGLYVHVVLDKSHSEATAVPSANQQLAQILVFETVTSGGFNKKLTLEDGAVLELGRYDHDYQLATSSEPSSQQEKSNSNSTTDVTTPPINNNNDTTRQTRRRFTQHFHFRKRSYNRSIAGPALAVVDADVNSQQDSAKKDNKHDEENEGVRIIIRLVALDEQGTELSSPNEQNVFLHIMRLGNRPSGVEDNRPWVVKVVKREATIGPHTFQLQEIYGLTSSSNPQTTSPHTYPPTTTTSSSGITTATAAIAATTIDDDDISSECLLCLSSPREVTLLPCRHLVACKECAQNMVEFGAGGNITQSVDPEPPVASPTTNTNTNVGDNANGDGDGDGDGDGSPQLGTSDGDNNGNGGGNNLTQPPLIPITTRRKRKAKGWFCPVCRQPYTSMLRITTSAPPIIDKEKEGILNPTEGTSSGKASTRQQPGTRVTSDTSSETGSEARTGTPGSLFTRPSFLRFGSSSGGGASSLPRPPVDVESQAGLGRPGA